MRHYRCGVFPGIAIVFFILSILPACLPEYYKFNKYIRYLDADSTYKTSREKAKFIELKAHFLKVWYNSSNCDIDFAGTGIHYAYKNAEEVYVDNILHTPNYDTLLVMVTIYGKDRDKNGNLITNDDDSSVREMTIAKGMKVLVDKEGSWHFTCKMKNFTSLATVKDVHGLSEEFRKEVIRWRYFNKNKTQDPAFFHRLFTDINLHPNSPWWWFMYRLFHPEHRDALPLK